MAYRRFFVEGVVGESIRIDGDLFHHVRDVCRFDVGQKFEILPGDGRAHLVEIVHVGKRELAARTVSARDLPPPPTPRVVLALSIPKLPKVDWIVEKCVELGVAEVRPFVSDYSFLRKLSDVSENRVARWRKLVQAATQQSGRGELMAIAEPTTLKALLESFRAAAGVAGIFPYEGEASQSLPDAIARAKASSPEEVWTFVGSEGGFSTAEVESFGRFGLKPTSLGEQILRVETACLAMVSVLKYELGALR